MYIVMFQQTVFSVAMVMLILALCGIGISLYLQKNNITYPPVIANCPDYWDVSGNLCLNSMSLGNSNCNVPMDFTTAPWSGNSGICNKYKWAKSCNMTWDGISDQVDSCENEDNWGGRKKPTWNSSGRVSSNMDSST